MQVGHTISVLNGADQPLSLHLFPMEWILVLVTIIRLCRMSSGTGTPSGWLFPQEKSNLRIFAWVREFWFCSKQAMATTAGRRAQFTSL